MNAKKKNIVISITAIVFFYIINIYNTFDVRKGIYNRFRTFKFTSENKQSSMKFPNSKILIKKLLKNSSEKLYDKFDILKTLESKNITDDFKELFMEMNLDHFSYEKLINFKLRYLIKDNYFNYKNANSPILFYCGNEGPIEEFWKNSGFITDYLAKKFGALVIFGEHRFFGKSFPFGGIQDKDPRKNKYLTSEQALSDFVELITNFKKENRLESNPVIAFGGSYGGMLSSWARMKFPHIFAGAVASSAPVLLFEDIKQIENSFFKIVTKTYERYDEKCPISIRSGFQKLFDFRNSTLISKNPSIHNVLNEIFKPCNKIQGADDIKKLEETVEDMIITLAQYNYPYETSFIKPTPAEPVKVACDRIAEIKNKTQFLSLSPIIASSINFAFNKYNLIDLDSKYKLMYLKAAIDVFFNFTGTEKCLDIGNGNSTQSNKTDLNGWSYMACTEMIMPMEKNGISDMFNPAPWNLDEYSKECKNVWKSEMRPNWIYNFFGGRDFYNEINNYSNIIYINGKMDPWNAGCPKNSRNPKVVIFEADSAHHLDLRAPNDRDPDSIVQARKIMELLIEKWIS